MQPEMTIGVGFTPRPWRTSLQRHVRDHVLGVALRVVREARMAHEEHIDVLVVDEEAPFLTPMFCSAMRERGVPIVGLYDPNDVDSAGEGFLRRCGIDVVFPVTVSIEDLVEALSGLAAGGDLDEAVRFADVVAGLELGGEEPPIEDGQILAVGGPAGAGATEIAVALAQAAAVRCATLLMDVDEVSPGVARRLSLALYPHLLSALDALKGAGWEATDPDGTNDPLVGAVARPLASADDPPFDVLAGLADPRDWPLLRGEDVEALLSLAATRWSTVVVNLGPHLEDLSRWVDRYAASRAALARAEHVVGVCEATPRGVLRFLYWLVDVMALVPEGPLDVVVNRAPRSGFHRAELVGALQEHAGARLASVTFVPEDRRVASAAWDGRLVPQGRFRRAVADVARQVLGGAPTPQAVVR